MINTFSIISKIILITVWTLVANVLVFSQEKNILFLGNSYTASHNLPEKVSKLASSMGDSVFYDSNTPGGYRLLNHASNATTLAKISQEDWDFVVLQAQSQEPSWPPSQVASEVLPYATILNDSIKSNNPCSETVFFMTWGRKYGDQQNCAGWPPVCTFLGMQERLMAGYMTMAEENGSTVAPVGLAWKHAMDNDPDSLINLYSGDNSHPSLSGTYLTACVMYATMFQKSPVGSIFTAGLPESQATFLQQMAEEVVLNEDYNFTFFDTYTNINYELDWQSWFDLGNVAIAGFNVIGLGATFSFSDVSLNADSWIWDFGDGSTSTLSNPSHIYTESGTYPVSQSVSNDCFDDVAYDTIQVMISLAEEILEQSGVFISPNPGKGIFELYTNCQVMHNSAPYLVMDVNGKAVAEGSLLTSNGTIINHIDLSNLENGIYYLRLDLGGKAVVKILIIH